MIQILGKHICDQCGKEELELNQCEQGHCLYKWAKQIPNDNFPLFKCMYPNCGELVFWD